MDCLIGRTPDPISNMSTPLGPLPRMARSFPVVTKSEKPRVGAMVARIPVKTGFPPLGSVPLSISNPSGIQSPSVSGWLLLVPTIRSPRSLR